MAALSQSRALAGCKAFTGLRPRAVSRLQNGGKVFMRRNDAYMIEVNVGEEEPEDIAIRRYMKAVMDSRVLDQLRARKTKESKIESYKRRLRERHEMRKSEFEWPTWEEVEGTDHSPKVFDEYFALDPEGEFGIPIGEDFLAGGELDANMWGGYMDGRNGAWDQGGYMDQAGYANQGAGFQGGYMDQGGYMAQGGYLNQDYSQGGYANQADYTQAGGYMAAPQGQAPGQGYTDAQGNFVYTSPQ